MPVLYTMTGKASEFKFARGRHEMAALRDMGYPSVPVIVPADQVKSFKQYLGASRANLDYLAWLPAPVGGPAGFFIF